MASILIVEDESVVAWHIQEALESLSHRVVGVTGSGAKALQLAAATQPDLILMDIRLQDSVDGITIAEAIYTNFDIPIVYLTAHADDDTLQRATLTNPFGYLLKPFQEQELHTTVQIALRRHQLEQSLKASQQWFATTLSSIGDATIAVDHDGNITFMNPVAETLTGWQQWEAIGTASNQVLCLVNRETRAAIDNPLMQAMQQGSSVTLADHILLLAKDGTEIPISDTASPIRNRDGEIIGSILVIQDATERQRTQLELRERNLSLEQNQVGLVAQLQDQNNQLQQMLACAQVLRHVLNQVLDNTNQSQVLQTISQGLAEALEADYCWIALHNEDHTIATITNEYLSDRADDRGSMIDRQISLNDFSHFYLQLSQRKRWVAPPQEILPTPYQSLLSPDDQVLICLIFDSQQVIGEIGIVPRRESHWSQAQAELISQIISQCAMLLRQSTHQAAQSHTEELDLLNQLREEFISSVSHELRTPLTNMRMAVEMLQQILRLLHTEDTQIDSENRQLLWQRLERYLQILQTEWQQEFNLVSDLLNFQDLKKGTDIRLDPTAFEQWLVRIIHPFVDQAAEQQQVLAYQIAPQLPSLNTHLPNLERIITELLTNACKYTPPNQQITIDIYTEASILIFKVTNTGVEIPTVELEKIFQLFYRIPHQNLWAHRGTGLGLALVRKLVTQLGGEIRATSADGSTTFTVKFPLVELSD